MSNSQVDENRYFRVFLIEDEEYLGADLVKVLERDLFSTSVVWAQTIQDGMLVLKQNLKPDVAISDIRLPRYKGDYPPLAHEDVADRLRSLHVPTIFITSWKESDDVKRFLKKRSIVDPTVMVFEKRGTWLRDVQDQIRLLFGRIASERIRELVDKFFGSSTTPSSISSTAKLIQLSSNYTACWPYLDDGTKELVHERFTVQQIEGRVWQLSLKE